ncbi:MAG: tetratricopeptide repeat protein [Pontiellaceae bacterium]|nr:tetratricopeptide repeat protein [Pontiellaceae bacterium]
MNPEEQAEVPASANQNRRIRVFVSSTFRDMVEDRNALMTHCWPELRRFCRERQVELVEVDLRWGIAEEQSTRKETLKLCLDEIRACRPFFIGLLGERYGWVPGDDAFTADLKEEQPWLKDLHGRSVTELEILHGVLRNPKMAGRAFFYFRDPSFKKGEADFASENEDSKKKQETLKTLIEQTCNSKKIPLRKDYPDPQALAKIVLEDLMTAIELQFPKGSEPDPLTKEARDHEAFAEIRRRTYIGRPDYFEALDRHAAGDGGPLVLLGDSGSGKSALLANWVERWRKANPNDFIFQHYIGGTPDSADHWRLMTRLIAEIKRWADDPEEMPKSHDDMLRDFPVWLAKARIRAERQGVRFIIILDALNQLEEADHARLLGWLPAHPFSGRLRLIVSTLPGDTLKAVEDRGWTSLRIQPLAVDERRRMIADYLARFGKKLDAPRLERLAAASAADNPLYLKILLDELRVTGTYDRLDERLGEYLAAPDIPSLLHKVLERYERDYERDRPELVGEALGLIWAARRGLTETELLELLGPRSPSAIGHSLSVSPVPQSTIGNRKSEISRLPLATWSPLRAALEEGLVDRGGILNFAHDFLRTAVEVAYACCKDKKRQYTLKLAEYFERINAPTERKLIELPTLYCKLEQWNRLKGLLSDIPTFLTLRSSEEWNQELHTYWTLLRLHYDAAEVYRNVLAPIDPQNLGMYRMSIVLTEVANFLSERGDSSSAEPMYVQALRTFEATNEPEDMTRAAVINNLACFYVVTGRATEAEPLLRNALDINEHFATNQLSHAKALANLGDLLVNQNRPHEAEPLIRKALLIEEHILGSHHPSIATTLNGLAQLLIITNRQTEAEELLKRALAIQVERNGSEHPEVARALHNLAVYLSAIGRMVEAHELFRRGLAIVSRTFGASSPICASFNEGIRFVVETTAKLRNRESSLSLALRNKKAQPWKCDKDMIDLSFRLAKVCCDLGRPSEGDVLVDQLLSQYEEQHAHDDDIIVDILENVVTLYYRSNRLRLSEPILQRTLAIAVAQCSSADNQIGFAIYQLAIALRKTGHLDDSETMYRQIISLSGQHGSASTSNIACAMHGLALTLDAMNRLKEAEELFRKSIQLLEESYGHDHVHVAAPLSGLGILLVESNRLTEAKPILSRALAIEMKAHGDEHPDVASVINNLGMLFVAAGQPQEGATMYERALRILTTSSKRGECSKEQLRTTAGNYAYALQLSGVPESEVSVKVHSALEGSEGVNC